MMRLAAVALAALLSWLAFPPVNAGFLIFLAPVPLLWALRTASSTTRALWLGALFGVLFFGATLSWIRMPGVVAWVALVFLMVCGAALCALLIGVARTWSPWRWWVFTVGAWALWEFLRARWPFGGFPWASSGYPIGTMPWPRGAAQWIGSSGWSVVVLAISAGIVLLVTDRARGPVIVGTVTAAALTVLGALFPPSAEGPSVAVVVVQGDSPCPLVHCDNEREIILESHLELTRTIEPGSADLVVWGENSFGGSLNPSFNPEVRSAMAGEALRIGSYLLVSGTRSVGDMEFENVNVVFDRTGRRIGEYMKQHPVPFGEYVPFRWVTRWVPPLERVPRDMVRGDGPVSFPIETEDGSGSFGSVISFEGAFVRLLRDGVLAGGEMMVVPTNEASFGDGPASDQLLGMVRMSAASLGVDIVVAAITGKSAIVLADGSIVATTGLFEPAILEGTVTLHQGGRTMYAAAGDWLQLLAVIAMAGAVVSRLGLWQQTKAPAEDDVIPYRVGE